MQAITLYHKLDQADVGTLVVDDHVLTYENNGKFHACKKGSRRPTFLCGASSPPDPTQYDYAKRRIEKYASADTPAEAMEHPAICKNCHRSLEKEFDLLRVIVAVPPKDSTLKQQELGSRAKTVEESGIEAFVEAWDERSQ